jgi:hypothetical protein
MARKKKLPGVAEGAVAEVPGEDAEVETTDSDEPEFDTSDEDEPEPEPEPALAASEEVAGTGPAIGDRVRYAEDRDGMFLDVTGRVLHAEGDLLTLELQPVGGAPARVVAASRFSQATRAGWWV